MKNIELLNLNDEQRELLTVRIDLQKRYAAISFRIVSVSDTEVVIVTHQDHSFHDNQFDHKRLREITKETFQDCVGERSIRVSIKGETQSAPDIVTPEWIRHQMSDHQLKLKNIVHDTGIHKATLSAYINGLKPLSGVTRAMFYFYFKSHE